MRTILILTLNSLVFAHVYPALAQDAKGAPVQIAERGSPTPERMMRGMDKDRDGRISSGEFPGPAQVFRRTDANGDGYLTEEELEAAFARRAQSGGKDGGGKPPLLEWYEKLPVIVTHAHADPRSGKGLGVALLYEETYDNAIKLMDDNNVRAAILMPTPFAGGDVRGVFESELNESRRFRERLKVAGGGDTLSRMIGGTNPEDVTEGIKQKFVRKADELARKGAVAYGETTALHFSFNIHHDFIETKPDHPLFLLLADMAAKHDIPIDFHMEAVIKKWPMSTFLRERSVLNPNWVDENISALERLLAHNRKAKIFWVHLGMDSTGQRTPALTRRLLRNHPNLFISINGFWRVEQGFAKKGSFKKNPHWLITLGSGLHPEWKNVITEFSDRFTIGSDVFFVPDAPKNRHPKNLRPSVLIVRKPFLPPDVARKLAFENAQRIFKFNIIRPEDYPLPLSINMAGSGGGPRPGPAARNTVSVMRMMDGNKDGRIAKAEFRGPPQRFGRLDSDNNGFLTKSELDAGFARLRARQQGNGSGPAQFEIAIKKPPAGPAAMPTEPPGLFNKPLSESEIKSLVTGNTLRFNAPRGGRLLHVHFGTDGTATVARPQNPQKRFRKKWFVNRRGMLCRTVGRNNRNHCMMVTRTATTNVLKLSNKKEGVNYEATVLEGLQLSQTN